MLTKVEQIDDTLFWHLPDIFNYTERQNMSELIKSINKNELVKKVTLDFIDTSYIDSSGLGLLLLLRTSLSKTNVAINLINPNKGTVKEVLKISNFEKLFTIIW